MNKIITGLLMIAMSAHISLAADKIVGCEIRMENKTAYKGTCIIIPEYDGSFFLANANRQIPLFENTSMVSVSLIENDVADVLGLTSAGLRTRWGEAKRSQTDKTCWIGYEFEICAR